MMSRPVRLILGAGAGIGGNVARRFAREGCHTCLARRSDKAGLGKLVAGIEAEGGSASGFMLHALEEGSIVQMLHLHACVKHQEARPAFDTGIET
jgi:NAD(P)-dependent dehydrogenase (short-subunit alcohol dehydrogenase family)